MRSTLSVLLILSTAFTCTATVQRMGLKAAMDKGLVKLNAVSNGQSYKAKALQLQITNTSKDALQITVDPALVFRPSDTGYQDLVLPGQEMLALAPNGASSLTVQTFCGKAHASAPGRDLKYSFIKQGDSSMIKVLTFIRKNNLYTSLGQHAVWVLTDHHDLESIFDPENPKVSSDLLALLVKLTGRRVPDYFKLYKLDTVAGQPVFQKRILKIVTNLEWQLPDATPVTLGIFNATGDLVQGVLDEPAMGRGKYRMMVQFEAENAPPGKYYVRLKERDQLKKEVTVVVD
jgi:hypothetical protein